MGIAPQSRESFEVVDEEGNVVGIAARERCHQDPSLAHRVAHIHVMDRTGSTYFCRRDRP